eukprot:TRINITY_DN1651_c0_g1_i1.p1 TRINITY_DN1651_c0_g1~~TRINITY_DN1651_c0_g1_i1.p1  ORF type:complete len:137 (+),score=35.50 TRINITY_DN1651_c0_g1_i1:125-535(+)
MRNMELSAGMNHNVSATIRWWENSIPSETELHPRSTVQDLLITKLKVTVIDIRSPDEFKTSHYPNAVNFPAETNPNMELEALEAHKGSHLVIVGNMVDETSRFANRLVYAFYPYVSVLNGGIDALEADARDLLVRS